MQLAEQLVVYVDGIPNFQQAVEVVRSELTKRTQGIQPITHRSLDYCLGLILTESYDGECPHFLGDWVEEFRTEFAFPILEEIIEKIECMDSFYTLVNFIPCSRLHHVMVILTGPIGR